MRKKTIRCKNFYNNFFLTETGRLGNCIFRYFQYLRYKKEFPQIKLSYLPNNYYKILENNKNDVKKFINKKNFIIDDYFQHTLEDDEKDEIIKLFEKGKDDFLITDGNFSNIKNYKYEKKKYSVKDLISIVFDKYYDLVIHIRLEDNVDMGIFLDINYIYKLIDKIDDEFDNACLVCTKAKTVFEKEYIENVQKYFYEKKNIQLVYETNDVITDFHIMKNAKILVCSKSTLSWAACILNKKIEKCYFPKWKKGTPAFDHNSVSIRNPIKNTIPYSINEDKINFSLCIPTMDRYEFLKTNLSKYIENPYITEIIICDENGNDVEKIKKSFDSKKLKLYVNDKKLGPLLNKINTLEKSNEDWVALIDSDNFADENYFNVAIKYIEDNKKGNMILCPSFSKPRFNFKKIAGLVYTRGKMKECFKKEIIRKSSSLVSINTGNYILNKNIKKHLNEIKKLPNIEKTPACDVIFFNYYLLKETDFELHIVKDLHYQHVVHNGSIYIKMHKKFEEFNKEMLKKYYELQ